jgi:hypothetical protein
MGDSEQLALRENARLSYLKPEFRNRRSSAVGEPRPDQSVDTNLLFRWMDTLQVDRRELENDDLLLFHELQSVCASCRSREECAQDLEYELGDARWNKWWVYCPNSAKLRALWRVATIGRVERQVPCLCAAMPPTRGAAP